MSSRRRRRNKVPDQLVDAEIESLAHDARGVAHIDGRTVFIDAALPGETVKVRYTTMRREVAEGYAVEVLKSSEQRIDPACEFTEICGGCSLQHMSSEAQISAKQSAFEEQLKRIGKLQQLPPFWPPLTGPGWGYRHKARLGVKYVIKKQRVLVGFREKRNRGIAEIDHCKVLHPQVGERLQALAELVGNLSIRDRIPQIEVAVADHRSALIFRVLDALSEEDCKYLSAFGEHYEFDIYIQPKGPDSIFSLYPEHPAKLNYALPDYDLVLEFHPSMFTQVNMDLNRKMVQRVVDLLQPNADDTVLDLFCGLGNFTLPLARQAGRVVGVEGGAVAVQQGRDNAANNGLDNIEFHVADLTQDLMGVPWAQGEYTKVLLDPSRAGAREVLEYLPKWKTKTIVYVSCNPSTLARDTDILVNELGFSLVQAGVMDMFPQTTHVESIALFEKI